MGRSGPRVQGLGSVSTARAWPGSELARRSRPGACLVQTSSGAGRSRAGASLALAPRRLPSNEQALCRRPTAEGWSVLLSRFSSLVAWVRPILVSRCAAWQSGEGVLPGTGPCASHYPGAGPFPHRNGAGSGLSEVPGRGRGSDAPWMHPACHFPLDKTWSLAYNSSLPYCAPGGLGAVLYPSVQRSGSPPPPKPSAARRSGYRGRCESWFDPPRREAIQTRILWCRTTVQLHALPSCPVR